MGVVKLSELVSGERTIDVPFGGHDITVSYRLAERTHNKAMEYDLTETVADSIVRMVVSWSIVDDKGKPLPLDIKNVGKLPVPFLRSVYLRITGDNGLGEASSSSDDGSAATD
jgi:hypothetical protein